MSLTKRLENLYQDVARGREISAKLERKEAAVTQITKSIRDAAGRVFDAMVARRAGPAEFLKALALPQLRTVFQNLSAELLKGLASSVPQIREGVLGRILKGTIFNAAPLEQAAGAQAAAAGALTSAAGALAAAGGAAGAGSPFMSQAFGGKLGGILSGAAGLLPVIAGAFGKTGAVLGSAAAGVIFGARGAGFGIAGLGKIGGAVLGGALTGGLAAGLVFGLPKLFARRQTPAERAAEIERIVEANRFTFPDALQREMGFTQEGFGEVDYGFGDVPRLVPRVVVNVSVNAMDSRSFLERAPEIAGAVRRAMLDMHPINQLVREAF